MKKQYIQPVANIYTIALRQHLLGTSDLTDGGDYTDGDTEAEGNSIWDDTTYDGFVW